MEGPSIIPTLLMDKVKLELTFGFSIVEVMFDFDNCSFCGMVGVKLNWRGFQREWEERNWK
jgi:hypothetical protein